MRYRGLTRLWALLRGADVQLSNNAMYPLVSVWSLIILASSNPGPWVFHNIRQRLTNFFDTTCVNLKPLARRTPSISHNTLSIHSTQKSKSWNNQMNLFWYKPSELLVSSTWSAHQQVYMIAINFNVISTSGTLTSPLRMLMENLTMGPEVNST